MKNYYQILGVPVNATNNEIKTAYRKLAIKFHPDKNEGDKYFEERFKEIQLAYDTLSNDYLRVEYDRKLFDFFQKASSARTQQTETKVKPETPKQNTEQKGKEKKNVFKTLKEVIEENVDEAVVKFFSSKTNIIWMLILSLPVIAYFVNSWTGVFSIIGLYLCILLFFGTIGKQKNGCFPLIIAVIAISILIDIFQFFFESKLPSKNPAKTNIETIDSAAVSVDSAAVPVDSAATEEWKDNAIPNINSVDDLYVASQRPTYYNSLKNGDSPLNRCFGKGKFGGQAYITFENSNETDVIVCLVNYSTDETIRNEYIKAGTDYTMRKISSGTYFLKVYYGNDWNPQKNNFCGTKGGFNFDESFSKSDRVEDLIRIQNTRTSYTTGTITLYKVTNGNMSSEQIDESEFFK